MGGKHVTQVCFHESEQLALRRTTAGAAPRLCTMFWSMRYAATSSIDTILEREGGFTLEELLEEDELLQECKSQNTKLLELCVRRPFCCAPRVVPTPHPSPPQFVRA